MFIKPFVLYPLFVLCGVVGFAIGGNVTVPTTINNTLKLCNQKPNECKFKYDILMYNETGKVPYGEVKPQEQPKATKTK